MKQSLWERLDPAIKSEIEKECVNHYLATKIKNKLKRLRYEGDLKWREIICINHYGNTRKLFTPYELFQS